MRRFVIIRDEAEQEKTVKVVNGASERNSVTPILWSHSIDVRPNYSRVLELEELATPP